MELAKVVESGDGEKGVVIASFGSAIDTRQEFEALEMSQGVFNRSAVAVLKLVSPFLN